MARDEFDHVQAKGGPHAPREDTVRRWLREGRRIPAEFQWRVDQIDAESQCLKCGEWAEKVGGAPHGGAPCPNPARTSSGEMRYGPVEASPPGGRDRRRSR